MVDILATGLIHRDQSSLQFTVENYVIVSYLVVVVITCFGCGSGCSCVDLVIPVMTWFWLQEVVVKVAGSFGGGCS